MCVWAPRLDGSTSCVSIRPLVKRVERVERRLGLVGDGRALIRCVSDLERRQVQERRCAQTYSCCNNI